MDIDALVKSFNEEDKERFVSLALNAIENKEMDIPFLYEEVLKMLLYSVDECTTDDCIWREHRKSSMVRTVIECMYPYVMKIKNERKALNKKVLLICPEKEYHELGLRMVDDFLQMNGYETIFIGTNTPKDQVLDAVLSMKADYLAISVTDYYLLFEAQKIINLIKENTSHVKIIVGGNAFKGNFESIKSIGGDIYLETYQDIKNLREGDDNEIIL